MAIRTSPQRWKTSQCHGEGCCVIATTGLPIDAAQEQATAICDEHFPAFTRTFKNPNLPRALAVREAYPRPRTLIDAGEGASAQGRIESGRNERLTTHAVPALSSPGAS
jgi:hypothetical protein